MAVQRGLRGLEGSQWVEKVALRGGKRAFAAAISERVPIDVAAIRRGANRPADRIDLDVSGEVSWDGDGATLTCRGSGTKLRLRNRLSTGRTDTPEDVVSSIQKQMSGGRTLFEVAGELVQGDDATFLNLTGARGL